MAVHQRPAETTPLTASPHPDDGSTHEDLSPEVTWVATRAEHISKTVKGLLVALAAALGLELFSDAGMATVALVGAVIAVMLGNVYADALQDEIRSARPIDRRALAAVIRRSVGVPLGALPAFVLFVLAAVDIIATDTAVGLTMWSGIGLLFGLGYVGGRVSGQGQGAAAAHGLVLAVIGVIVLALRSLP